MIWQKEIFALLFTRFIPMSHQSGNARTCDDDIRNQKLALLHFNQERCSEFGSRRLKRMTPLLCCNRSLSGHYRIQQAPAAAHSKAPEHTDIEKHPYVCSLWWNFVFALAWSALPSLRSFQRFLHVLLPEFLAEKNFVLTVQ